MKITHVSLLSTTGALSTSAAEFLSSVKKCVNDMSLRHFLYCATSTVFYRRRNFYVRGLRRAIRRHCLLLVGCRASYGRHISSRISFMNTMCHIDVDTCGDCGPLVRVRHTNFCDVSLSSIIDNLHLHSGALHSRRSGLMSRPVFVCGGSRKSKNGKSTSPF